MDTPDAISEAVASLYRAEFGAVYHHSHAGFLFTVSPPQCAEEVADALNKRDELQAQVTALKAGLERIRDGSIFFFSQQRFAEDSDTDYFLRCSRAIQTEAARLLAGENNHGQ